jgi:hypothetical protein
VFHHNFLVYNNISKRIISTTLFISPVTESKVEGIIKNLKNPYSAGFDEIPEIVLKKGVQHIIKPLTHIFNLSLQTGIFPGLKIAKLRPILKKSDRFAINNYRPISVLSVFSKILEKLMYNRLISYIEAFNILTFEQHGFRKNKSTNTAVQSLVE